MFSVAACCKNATLDTESLNAKHDSAAWKNKEAWQSAGSAHMECCPPKVWADGHAKTSTYVWERPEGFVIPSKSELEQHPEVATVQLQMLYSAKNTDNFLGTNASNSITISGADDYKVVGAVAERGPAHLGHVAATIFKEQINSSYVPLDVFWNEKRKDYQVKNM